MFAFQNICLCLLVACSTTSASRYGLLRAGTPSTDEAPKVAATEESSRRSLIEEDFQVVYRQLVSYQSSTTPGDLSMARTADLSMAPLLSMAPFSFAPLMSMAPLSMAPISDVAPLESTTTSFSSRNSNPADSTPTDATTNAADGDDELNLGITGGVGVLAGLALVLVAAATYKMVRRRTTWRYMDGDDSSLSSLPTTVYFGNGNCGTF